MQHMHRALVALLIAVQTLGASASAAPSIEGEGSQEITGVVDREPDHAIESATVMVYKARVRHGYSVFCPTCWVDCGKRATTDADGRFTIRGLSPDLIFTLLVIKNGFRPEIRRAVDPSVGAVPQIVLRERAPIDDQRRVTYGKVIDRDGAPIAGAIVTPTAVTVDRPDASHTMVGDGLAIDAMAVSGEDGNFEIAYPEPVRSALVRVEARGKAAKLAHLASDGQRSPVVLDDGVEIAGIVKLPSGSGAHATEVELALHHAVNGEYFPDLRIGTREDGSFAIPNVPAGYIWDLYPKMDSLASRNLAALRRQIETKSDGARVRTLTLQLHQGFTLRGRIDMSGAPAGVLATAVILASDSTADMQRTVLGPNGEFAFHGLSAGVYGLMAESTDQASAIKSNRDVLIEADRSDVILTLGSEGSP